MGRTGSHQQRKCRINIANNRKLLYSYRLFVVSTIPKRRDGRVVDGARLESVYTATYRGFESLFLRQINKTRKLSGLAGFLLPREMN